MPLVENLFLAGEADPETLKNSSGAIRQHSASKLVNAVAVPKGGLRQSLGTKSLNIRLPGFPHKEHALKISNEDSFLLSYSFTGDRKPRVVIYQKTGSTLNEIFSHTFDIKVNQSRVGAEGSSVTGISNGVVIAHQDHPRLTITYEDGVFSNPRVALINNPLMMEDDEGDLVIPPVRSASCLCS